MKDSRTKNLTNAVVEAERFYKEANAAIDRINNEEYMPSVFSSKETAAAKRASMDLTRALVAVSNPHNNGNK